MITPPIGKARNHGSDEKQRGRAWGSMHWGIPGHRHDFPWTADHVVTVTDMGQGRVSALCACGAVFPIVSMVGPDV